MQAKYKSLWYDPSEILGTIDTTDLGPRHAVPSNTDDCVTGSKCCDETSKNVFDSSDIEIEFIREPRQEVTGKPFKLTIDYLQTYFEEAVENHRKVWEYRRRQNYPDFHGTHLEKEMLRIVLEYLEEDHIAIVAEEWSKLRECWEERGYLIYEEVEEVQNILNNLHNQIKDKIMQIKREELRVLTEQTKWKTLHMNHNYKVDSDLGLMADFEKGTKRSRWESEVQRITMQLVVGHERFGNIFVPEEGKIKIPCGKDGYFCDLELGIDGRGSPKVVKYLKSTCSKSELATAVAKVKKIRHDYLLPCYLSPGPICVVATPLMEYNLGQLVMHLSTTGRLQEEMFRIAQQFTDGLQFLHVRKEPIIHGNLKPTNIFVDSDGVVKIAEFGLILESKSKFSTSPSSLIWKAGEQLKAHFSNQLMSASLETDVVSAGMLLHFILSGGRHPYGVEINEILSNLAKGTYELSVVSSSGKDMLMKMLEVDPKRRSTLNQIARHIFWWPSKSQWQFVAASSNLSRPCFELRAFISEKVADVSVNNDGAILSSKGGQEEMKNELTHWLDIMDNIVESEIESALLDTQNQYPNLPLHLYRILSDTHWTSSNLLKDYFKFVSQTENCWRLLETTLLSKNLVPDSKQNAFHPCRTYKPNEKR